MENFPFFSISEFNTACEEFESRSQKVDWNVVLVKASQEDGDRHLKISHQISIDPNGEVHALKPNGCGGHEEDFEDSFEEIDEEAVHYPREVLKSATVEYQVFISKTYFVPMLLFFIHSLPSHAPHGIDSVYRYLVPVYMRPQLGAIGVMGGISMINHPSTDVPCFSVHPCNTADAMRELVGSRKISALEYLEIWVGLVGGCVGLYLPKELAIEIEKTK